MTVSYSHNSRSGFQRMLRVFQPTLTSAIISSVLSVVLLGDKVLELLPGNEALYESIYGENGILRFYETSNYAAIDLYQQVANSTGAYVFFVALVALTIGMIIYLVIKILNRVLYDIDTTWHVWRAHPSFTAGGIRDMVARAILRAVLLVMWVCFCFVTLRVIWPFCILAVSTGINQLPSGDAIIYLAGYGFGLFLVTLHIHVVLLRLIALKPRLVGPIYEIT